jgi:two-component system chemotaxis response regulator CheY
MSQTTRTILVVDDSTTVRQLIKMTLNMHLKGAVLEAADGVDAMSRLRVTPVDLVITDINMPNMDGLQLVKAVREEIGLAMPVIIVTTRGADAEREEGLRLGANTYLTKPVTATSLMAAIKGLGLD